MFLVQLVLETRMSSNNQHTNYLLVGLISTYLFIKFLCMQQKIDLGSLKSKEFVLIIIERGVFGQKYFCLFLFLSLFIENFSKGFGPNGKLLSYIIFSFLMRIEFTTILKFWIFKNFRKQNFLNVKIFRQNFLNVNIFRPMFRPKFLLSEIFWFYFISLIIVTFTYLVSKKVINNK